LVQLTQMRITNPLCFVASVFGSSVFDLRQDPIDSGDVPLSLGTDMKKSFNELNTVARLRVGFTVHEDERLQFTIR
jgi:hypothetical protein